MTYVATSTGMDVLRVDSIDRFRLEHADYGETSRCLILGEVRLNDGTVVTHSLGMFPTEEEARGWLREITGPVHFRDGDW